MSACAYYNETDPYAAQWLRNLIRAHIIAPGDVDERSIEEVAPAEIANYTQAHFFAGVGGWSVALRLAGWPDSKPVWTGSCPCQPFSVAGKKTAATDERHLWPSWFSLIAKLHPARIFGEQVEAAISWGWIDAAFADLESEGYACGASVLPACCVGAPHVRQRLWFVANATGSGSGTGQRDSGTRRQRQPVAANGGQLGNTQRPRPQRHGGNGDDSETQRPRGTQPAGPVAASGNAGVMADTDQQRCEGVGLCLHERRQDEASFEIVGHRKNNFWSDCVWLPGADGKARPTGPGIYPLAYGIRRRASKLCAYGNAIVPQVAAEFIKAAGIE